MDPFVGSVLTVSQSQSNLLRLCFYRPIGGLGVPSNLLTVFLKLISVVKLVIEWIAVISVHIYLGGLHIRII